MYNKFGSIRMKEMEFLPAVLEFMWSFTEPKSGIRIILEECEERESFLK